MNLKAGVIEVKLVEVEGTIVARASVLVHGAKEIRFEVPLEPELRDIRDDVATVASRAADTLLALVRDIAPYADDDPRGHTTVPFDTDVERRRKEAALSKLMQIGTTSLMSMQESHSLASPLINEFLLSVTPEQQQQLIENTLSPQQLQMLSPTPHAYERGGAIDGGRRDQFEMCGRCGFDKHNLVHMRHDDAEDRWVPL